MKDYGGKSRRSEHHAGIPELVLNVVGSWKHRGTGTTEKNTSV